MLYHFSEEADIKVFEPRSSRYRPEQPPMVWEIDEFHAPHYFFPRDCPRVCIWPKEDTSKDDLEKFFGHSASGRIIAVEADWLDRIRETVLYRYTFDEKDFVEYEPNAGYYTCFYTVEPVAVEPMGDLLR